MMMMMMMMMMIPIHVDHLEV